MTAEEERTIPSWLTLIEETDSATIAQIMDQRQQNGVTRHYFLEREAGELPKRDPLDNQFDDLLTTLIEENWPAGMTG